MKAISLIVGAAMMSLLGACGAAGVGGTSSNNSTVGGSGSTTGGGRKRPEVEPGARNFSGNTETNPEPDTTTKTAITMAGLEKNNSKCVMLTFKSASPAGTATELPLRIEYATFASADAIKIHVTTTTGGRTTIFDNADTGLTTGKGATGDATGIARPRCSSCIFSAVRMIPARATDIILDMSKALSADNYIRLEGLQSNFLVAENQVEVSKGGSSCAASTFKPAPNWLAERRTNLFLRWIQWVPDSIDANE